jgi:hypothetical protein
LKLTNTTSYNKEEAMNTERDKSDWFFSTVFALTILALVWMGGIDKGREGVQVAVEDATALTSRYVDEIGAELDKVRQENIEFRDGGCYG